MLTFNEEREIRGHLTITKKYDDHEEVVFDDHNMIVSGFSVGLAYLFAGEGSDSIVDYQLSRVQIGVSADAGSESESLLQLYGPLSSTAEYGGDNSNLLLGDQLQVIGYGDPLLVESKAFIHLPFSQVAKLGNTNVRYTIILDRNACNNLSRGGSPVNINEIGLFMKGPINGGAALLCAYRQFSDIRKTDEFSLVFQWQISF